MSPRFDAARRAPGPELMDDPAVDAVTLAACYADLAGVTTLTLGRRPVLDLVARAARLVPGRRLVVRDLGCGGGDTLRALAAFARRRGLDLALEGVDRSPAAIDAARATSDPADAIAYRVGDALADEGERPDLIVTSLVAHHLADDEIPALLAGMERRARLGFLVVDLRRSRLAFHGFRALATVLRRHPFVRHDGPLSIARGFVEADWRRYAAAAGLADVVAIRRRFPFRLVVERLRPEPAP
ncbi:methyltransferase domain-containing protein [Salinarimonas rosea]|uniref:methyltransferase domain-containing protein n=1 Tax=Salinarimonas rosea TaxID=552063 RepID=UPI00040D3436|nr:methyltransferase domain-containing protein [Salinarimonas rosea]